MASRVANARIEIEASPQEVWKALTEPALIGEYMFGTHVETDWEPGGDFERPAGEADRLNAPRRSTKSDQESSACLRSSASFSGVRLKFASSSGESESRKSFRAARNCF